MSSSRQARRMRTAISPRLAMRILRNMAQTLFSPGTHGPEPGAILARRDFQRLYGLLGRIEFGDFGHSIYRAVSLGNLAFKILYGGAMPGLAVQAIDGFMQ